MDAVGLGSAIGAIEGLVGSELGGAVFTPNVDHVVTAERDAAFRAAYDSASLSLADGQYLVWASRLLGTPLPEKISGSDLVEPLMRIAARLCWRVFLLGGAPGVAAEAGERARRDFGVNVVGTASPFVQMDGSDSDWEQGMEAIAATRPQLVLVAFGAPKQERWIYHNRERLGPSVAMGVGASLDFFVGRVRRAPAWVSRIGFEWLYRLAQEPRRLGHRYLVKDPRFIGVILRTAAEPRSSRLRTVASQLDAASGSSEAQS
jgi:N-acetylglucosaminyldiphosphoundecaprenol N-acetyl-beta-D-mannosaminyltransferase